MNFLKEKNNIVRVLLSIVVFIFIIFIFLIFNPFKKYNKGRVVAIINNKKRIYGSDIQKRLSIISPNKKIKLEEIPEDVMGAIILENLIQKDISKFAHKKNR